MYSHNSFFVYWFCILQLHWICLLVLTFFMMSSGFSTYNAMSSANSFTTFLSWMPFIYFCCLIALVRTSSTKLNKSGRRDILVMFLTIEEEIQLSPLSKMLAVYLGLYIAFIMLRYVPSLPAMLTVFIINGCWILLNVFSASIERIL